MSGTIAWLGWWAGFYVLYLALVDTRQPPELVLAAIVAAAGATAAMAVRRTRRMRAKVDRGMLRRMPGAVWRLPTETALVLGVAVRALAGRRPKGRFRAVAFRGGGNGRRDVARRALSESIGSLGPNTIVIGVDRDRDLILVHQLVRSDEDLDPLELG